MRLGSRGTVAAAAACAAASVDAFVGPAGNLCHHSMHSSAISANSNCLSRSVAGPAWGRLFSAAVEIDESSSSATGDKSQDIGASIGADRVVARGEVVHFTPAPPGSQIVGSVAAIRLRDEDVLPPGKTVESMGSKPGVFGAKVEKEGVIDANDAAPKSASTTKKGGAGTSASGQSEDFVGRTVIFPSGRSGVVIAERPPIAFVMCDFSNSDEAGDAEQDASVAVMGSMMPLSVSESMMGTVVDYQGRIMETIDETTTSADNQEISKRAIFAPIPKVGDIALINSPMLTGKAMIDALAPLGKGQNTLLVGADRSETRGIGIDSLATQVELGKANGDEGVKCVYALTSSDPAEKADVLKRLKDAGISDSVVVVAARGDESSTNDDFGEVRSAAEAVSVAAAASAIGEAHALALGRDALVIIDSIDQHKLFWDWTTRVLVDVYGVDAVVKDDRDGGASSEMRGFFSALIQRAGQFNKKRGGGSVTLVMMRSLPGQEGAGSGTEETTFTPEDFAGASEKVKERIAILTTKNIPLTPTNLKKIQIPVPVASDSEQKRRLELQHVDDLISMSDGQCWLDESLASGGQKPSLDPQRSITRIGIGADTMSRADAPAMRNLVGGLRFELAQAAALEGAGEGSGADRQIRRRDSWMLAMQQDIGERRALSENAVLLLAASIGALDEVVRAGGKAGTAEGADATQKLLEDVKVAVPDAMEEIDRTFDLTEEVRDKLEAAINQHFEA